MPPKRLPSVIGLCSDVTHAEEFYIPDPKPGEQCPWCDRKLVHYKRTTYSLESTPIGYEACWTRDSGGRHCRKPKGHEGLCAFI